jgi:hypothetical protein
MSAQVTVTLPDELNARAQRLALLTRWDVTDVLADTLALALPAVDTSAPAHPSVDTLTDAELLALDEIVVKFSFPI